MWRSLRPQLISINAVIPVLPKADKSVMGDGFYEDGVAGHRLQKPLMGMLTMLRGHACVRVEMTLHGLVTTL